MRCQFSRLEGCEKWASCRQQLPNTTSIEHPRLSPTRAAASPREYNYYESPYRPILPISAYAMAAARHMHQYGTTREHLAEVAVAARRWALMNPKAWEKEPLTSSAVPALPIGTVGTNLSRRPGV